MERRGPPTWFVVWISAAAALVLVLIGVGIYEVMDEQGENRSQCEQTVGFRADSRTMWLALFDAFPDAAIRTGLRELLETTQPPLTCVGSNPQPIPVTLEP